MRRDGAAMTRDDVLAFDLATAAGFASRVTDSAHAAPRREGGVTALVEDLGRLELERGSIIMLALPNGAAAVEWFFAALHAGLVPLPAAPGTQPPRVREIARRVGAAVLVHPQVDAYGAVVTPDPQASPWLGTFEDVDRVVHRPGDVILLTSGTSGVGTGCVHDFASLVRNATRHGRSIGQTQDDTVLVSLPWHYSFTLVAQIVGAAVFGSRLVIAGPPFTPAAHRDSVDRHGVTLSSLTPLLVEQLLSAESVPRSLRALTVGGSALDPRSVGRLSRMGPDEVYLTYGLTEAGPRVSTLPAHAVPARLHGSVGRPIEGTELTTAEAAVEAGRHELVVRSDTVCRATVGGDGRAGKARLLSPGVLGTGDLGRVDDEGYVFLEGRLSDFAIVRGDKVSLGYVRRVARAIPGVVRAAVRVTEDERLELSLDVEPRARLQEADVRRALAGRLSRSETPSSVIFRSAGAADAYK